MKRLYVLLLMAVCLMLSVEAWADNDDDSEKYTDGPKGYRELKEENQRKLEKYKDVEVPVLENRVYSPDEFYYEGPAQSRLLQQTKGEDYIGNSICDPESFTAEEAFGDNRDIENARGEKLGWILFVVIIGGTVVLAIFVLRQDKK